MVAAASGAGEVVQQPPLVANQLVVLAPVLEVAFSQADLLKDGSGAAGRGG